MEAIFALVIISFVIILAIKSWFSSTQEHDVNTEVPDAPIQRTKRSAFDETAAAPSTKPRKISGRAYIIDGDTLTIQKTQIRLFGIDAPELNHPYGQKAKWALLALCKNQIIEAEILTEDTHGRTVAKCTLHDGRDLSAEMVRQGLAIDWPKFSNGLYQPLEVADVRKKLWLADARQKGRLDIWERYEARQKAHPEK